MTDAVKQNVWKACMDVIGERIAALGDGLAALHESMQSETKSSAGDKHETARARMQAEGEALRSRLEEAMKMKDDLERLNLSESGEREAFVGSLVETSHGYFFLSVALGRVLVNDLPVF